MKLISIDSGLFINSETLYLFLPNDPHTPHHTHTHTPPLTHPTHTPHTHTTHTPHTSHTHTTPHTHHTHHTHRTHTHPTHTHTTHRTHPHTPHTPSVVVMQRDAWCATLVRSFLCGDAWCVTLRHDFVFHDCDKKPSPKCMYRDRELKTQNVLFEYLMTSEVHAVSNYREEWWSNKYSNLVFICELFI